MARPKLERPNYRLSKRGDRFYVGFWENGADQRLSTGQTERRAAEVWLAQFIAGRETAPIPKSPTVSVILDAYLIDRKPVVHAYETLEVAAKVLRRHLGDLLPEHLTKERIRFYHQQRRAEGHMVGPPNARRKKPTSDGTIIRELVTLRAALRLAKQAQWWLAGDVPHIEVPSQPAPRDRWLTRAEVDRLLEEAQAFHVRLFIALAIHTAARSSAILELTWDRVDLDTGMIHLGDGRGNKRRGIVPINSALRPYLEEAHKAATCPYVIEHGSSRVGSVKKGFATAARRAGIEGVSAHILRHSAATWMAMKGIRIEEIARVLGHSNPSVTWKTYAKYSPDYLREAVAALAG